MGKGSTGGDGVAPPSPGQAETWDSSAGRGGGRVGVIDIGSNSIRLVIFEGRARVPVPVFNEKVICALGKGLAQSGRLSEEGKALALESLIRFSRLAEAMAVTELMLVATAAVRDAGDGAAFAETLACEAGYPVRILSGEEEAMLAAFGVIVGIPAAEGLVGDLGGGSLELIEVGDGSIGRSVTLPLGPLRILDACGDDRGAAERLIDECLAAVPWLDESASKGFYAVGGAWRNIARLHMQQSNYPLHVIQNYSMPAPVAIEFAQVIAQQGKGSLARMPAISRRRIETLPAAALTLAGLLRRATPMSVVYSSFGLREGLLYEGLNAYERGRDPLLLTAEGLARREGRFPQLGASLYDWLAAVYLDVRGLEGRLVAAACHLADIAWRDHPDYRARQAINRLLFLPYAGLDHPGRAFLALVAYVRYGGSIVDDEAAEARVLLSAVARHEARLLGLGIRLACSVCGGAIQILERSRLTILGERLCLSLPPDGSLPPGSTLTRRLEVLAEALGLDGSQVVLEEAGRTGLSGLQ